MSFFRYCLLSGALISAIGAWFYFYEPELSPQASRWVEAGAVETDIEAAERMKELGEHYDQLPSYDFPDGCLGRLFSVSCYQKTVNQEISESDLARRQAYREMTRLMPYPSDEDRYPPFQAMIKGMRDDLRLDFNFGALSQETAELNANFADRMTNTPQYMIGVMIGASLHDYVLRAANLSLGLKPGSIHLDSFKDELVVDVSIEAMFQRELAYANRLFQGQSNWYKANWFVDDHYNFLSTVVAFYNANPSVYWTTRVQFKRHWFVETVTRLTTDSPLTEEQLEALGEDWEFNAYTPYLDQFKIRKHSHLVLLALDAIYQGAAIDNHGIEAPKYWQWHWKEQELELCLKLSDEFEETKRTREAIYCLPHVQLQAERLSSMVDEPS